jgi:DNA (cytosine-5)-methyltransferase 1
VTTVELFAGPGGFSLGAVRAGVTDLVGFEWDAEACATAEAAGHKRIQADVSMVDVREWAHAEGEIGSPPCQSYSSAGKQKGKLDRPRIEAHVARVKAAGRWLHYSREGWHDPRSPLVLEPLRFALGILPEWIALEQVPAVLPLWQAMADVLRDHGYHTDTGVLSAEQYGVPQTRKRAFLIARRCEWHASPRFYDEHGHANLERMADLDCPRRVELPAPTHRKYRKGVPQAEGDPALLPWVSMAQALGWGMVARPSTTVVTGANGGGSDPMSGGSGTRAVHAGHDRAERVWEPAAVAAEEGPDAVAARFGNQEHSAVRTAGEPAATVRYSERMNANDWVPTGQARNAGPLAQRDPRGPDDPSYTIRAQGSGSHPSGVEWTAAELHSSGPTAADREGRSRVAPRAVGDPAPTMRGSGRNVGYWTGERPATTVQGDARIWPPGHKVNGDDRARLGEDAANERYGDRAGTKAVRVSVQRAAVLQTFPPDYPWQGSKTAQYRQVGDAVPPLLAEQVVNAALTGRAI